MHIHELIRKQRIVGIVEYGFQPRGAGALVDLIVDGEKRSRRDFHLIVAIVGIRL